jgi:threonine dehydrogenase-like Zn-dependent dehydrogenase
MKGLFIIQKDQLAIRDLPEPVPGPFEALVQVEACAICNSTDWKVIKGEFVSGTYPILLGHESVGRVIQVGEKVRSFQLGDRVLRTTLRDEHLPFPGGRCCWGGFVEKALVTDVWAEKDLPYNAFPHPQQIVPQNIPSDQATALITLKETLSCLENTDIKPGQSLAIIGTGPVAQTLTRFAKLLGIQPVVVFGRNPGWADTFSRLGADAYVSNQQFPIRVEQLIASGGFDRVIEAVGSREALSFGLKITQPQGRINLYGIPPEAEPYLPGEETDPRVFRSKVAEAETHGKLLEWITEQKIVLSDWVTCTLPWSDYSKGFELVKHKKANKVVLAFL